MGRHTGTSGSPLTHERLESPAQSSVFVAIATTVIFYLIGSANALTKNCQKGAAGGEFTCVVDELGKMKCWGRNDFGQLGYETTNYRGDTENDRMGNYLPFIDFGPGVTARSLHSGSGNHQVVVLSNGKVKAWGLNDFGQLGLGDTENRGDDPGEMGTNLPVVDLGATTMTAMIGSAGQSHTCIILSDGTLKCFGRNTDGQLGLGHTRTIGDEPGEMGDNLPVVNLGTNRTVLLLACGFAHTCAVLDSGRVKCFGFNSSGQLGLGHTRSIGTQPGEMGEDLEYVDLGTLSRPATMQSGAACTCIAFEDGSFKCWGSNSYGQLGLGDTNARGDGPNEMGYALPALDLGPDFFAVDIGSGYDSICARSRAGQIKCVGRNDQGQLGVGDILSRGNRPGDMGTNLTAVDLGKDVIAVELSCGDKTCCALTAPRFAMKCWGGNAFGSLGQLATDNRGDGPNELGDFLQFVNLGTRVTLVSVHAAGSSERSCGRTTADRIKCWGGNQNGELGYGDVIRRGDGPGNMGDALPHVDLGVGFSVHTHALGYRHACAATVTGHLKCWGNGAFGALGNSKTSHIGDDLNEMGDPLNFIELGGDLDIHGLTVSALVDTVAAGNQYTCIITKSSFRVKCFGANWTGQLGLGDTNDRGDNPGEMGDALEYVDLGSNLRALSIGVGHSHACALLENGRLRCWGGNELGQLGLNDTKSRGDEPMEMGENLPYIDLGNIGDVAHDTPIISVGGNMSCVALNTGCVKCWGSNEYGQLGQGDTRTRGDAPDEMGDSLLCVSLGSEQHSVTMIATGGYHVCALLQLQAAIELTLKCWGRNDYGQLGYGDTTHRGDGPNEMGTSLFFIDLGGNNFAVSIMAGTYHTCAVLFDGSFKCWGGNLYGQLGLGATFAHGDQPGEMGFALPSVQLQTFCSSCPIGQFLRSNTGACLRCAGEPLYEPTSLNTACAVCEPGTYNDASGRASCIPCPAGTASMGVARTSAESCLPCPGDKNSCAGSHECISCAIGEYLLCNTPAGTGGRCVGCPAGRYGILSGQVEMELACGECNPGEFQETTGALSCAKCGAGRYGTVKGAASESAGCHDCEPGQFSPDEGVTICLPCPLGSYSEALGSINCIRCPAGTYNAETGGSSEAACETCPGLFTTSESGSNQCSCLQTLSMVDGNSNCLCSPGRYFSTSAMQCVECGQAEFSSEFSLSVCTVCPVPGLMSTTGTTKNSLDTCQCVLGYYRDIDADGEIACVPCPVGAVCKTPNILLETLPLAPGFWRASNSSDRVIMCTAGNTGVEDVDKRCIGGLGSGDALCALGSQGPICGVCSPNYYYTDMDRSCRPCGGKQLSVFAIAIAGTALILGIAFMVWICVGVSVGKFASMLHTSLLSFTESFTESSLPDDGKARMSKGEEPSQDRRTGAVPSRVDLSCTPVTDVNRETDPDVRFSSSPERWSEGNSQRKSGLRFKVTELVAQGQKKLNNKLGLSKPKNAARLKKLKAGLLILVTVFQVTTALPPNLRFRFPGVFYRFLHSLRWLNMNFISYVPMECAMHSDFFVGLIGETMFPLILAALLQLMTMWLCHRLPNDKKDSTESMCFGLFLLLTFIVYPSVSAAVLQTFECDRRIDDFQGSGAFMRVDYSISCSSSYYATLRNYAIVMIALYPVGIPILYFTLLYGQRHRINPYPCRPLGERLRVRSGDSKLKSISFLFAMYKPDYWWWESYDCLRRLSLTGLLVVFGQGSALQMVIGCLFALYSIFMHSHFQPFLEPDLNSIAEIAHYQTFLTIFAALCLKLRAVGGIGPGIDELFGVMLLLLNLCAPLAVVFTALKDLKVIPGLDVNSGQPSVVEMSQAPLGTDNEFGTVSVGKMHTSVSDPGAGIELPQLLP